MLTGTDENNEDAMDHGFDERASQVLFSLQPEQEDLARRKSRHCAIY